MANAPRVAMLSSATCILLGAGSAAAIDDRFNPHSYEKGGFAPVNNAAYSKESGDCHDKAATGSFAYDEIAIQDVTKVIRPGDFPDRLADVFPTSNLQEGMSHA